MRGKFILIICILVAFIFLLCLGLGLGFKSMREAAVKYLANNFKKFIGLFKDSSSNASRNIGTGSKSQISKIELLNLSSTIFSSNDSLSTSTLNESLYLPSVDSTIENTFQLAIVNTSTTSFIIGDVTLSSNSSLFTPKSEFIQLNTYS